MFGFFNLGPQEVLILVGLGVLLFGKKLPEVGRSVGRAVVEFKKGITGVEDEVHAAVLGRDTELPRTPQRIATALPRFEDNGSAPLA